MTRSYGFDTGTEEVYYWYTADDVIVTETSTFRGTLEADTIQATTKFFGETKLKLADLRTLRNVILDPAPKPVVATAPVRPNRQGGIVMQPPIFVAPPPGAGR